MKRRLFLAKILFWLHLVIVLAWLGLFLVPTGIWQGRISFHFHLTVFIVAQQFIWGLIILPWTKRFHMACILTTPMHLLRGLKLSDPKTYDYSWFVELAERRGIKIPQKVATIVTFSALILVTYQYFFLR
jgi:hypothetical protein